MKYQDPMEPKLAPAPIEGAYINSNLGSNVGGAAVGAITAGLGAAATVGGSAALQGLGLAAGPVGWAVGALSFLSAL